MKVWVIPPLENSDFVAPMELVLDVYKTPYDEEFPVVCMDESPKQLIKQTRILSVPVLTTATYPVKTLPPFCNTRLNNISIS